MRPKYQIDNDDTGTKEATVPRKLNEEQRQRYSVKAAEADYAHNVYYAQRSGGDGWFSGRVSNKYRENYDAINWER